MLPSSLKQFVTTASVSTNVQGLASFGVTEAPESVFGLSGIWNPDSQVLEISVGQRPDTGFNLATVISGFIGIYVTTTTQDPDTEPYLFKTLELQPDFLKMKPVPHWDLRLNAPIWPRHLVLACTLTTQSGPVNALAPVACLDPSIELARYRVDHRFFYDDSHVPASYIVVDKDHDLSPFRIDFTQADNMLTGSGVISYSGGGNRWAQLRDQTMELQPVNSPLWGMDAHVFIEDAAMNYFGNTALLTEPTYEGNARHNQKAENSMLDGYLFRTGNVSSPSSLNSESRVVLGATTHGDLPSLTRACASIYASVSKSRPEIGAFLRVDFTNGAANTSSFTTAEITDSFDIVSSVFSVPASHVVLSLYFTNMCPGDRVEYACLAPQIESSSVASSRLVAFAARDADMIDFAPETPIVDMRLRISVSVFHTDRECSANNTLFDTRNSDGQNGYWVSLNVGGTITVGVAYESVVWVNTTVASFGSAYGTLTTYCLWIDQGALRLFRNNVVVMSEDLPDVEIPGTYLVKVGRDYMDRNYCFGEYVMLSADTSPFNDIEA